MSIECQMCKSEGIVCRQQRGETGKRTIVKVADQSKWMIFYQEIKDCHTKRVAKLASLQVIRELQK